MEDFKSCGKCDNGYIYEGDGAKKCGCLRDYQNSVKFEALKLKANIEGEYSLNSYVGPDEYKNIDKLRVYLSRYQEKFKKGSNLWFWSSENGTQKTTIAKAVGIEVLKFGFKVRFELFSNLVNYLLKSERDDEYNYKLEEIQDSDLLILDECFSSKKSTLYSSGYQIAFVDKFLRTRIETLRRNTIFTSNIKISDIAKEGYSPDIQDLLDRSIYQRSGQLEFKDRYFDNVSKFDIESMWD